MCHLLWPIFLPINKFFLNYLEKFKKIFKYDLKNAFHEVSLPRSVFPRSVHHEVSLPRSGHHEVDITKWTSTKWAGPNYCMYCDLALFHLTLFHITFVISKHDLNWYAFPHISCKTCPPRKLPPVSVFPVSLSYYNFV